MPLPPCSMHKPVASTAPIMTAQLRCFLCNLTRVTGRGHQSRRHHRASGGAGGLAALAHAIFSRFSRAFAARGHDERCGEEQGGNGRCESWLAIILLLLHINLNHFPALFFSSILSAFIPTFDPPPCLLRCARNSTTLAQTTTAAAAKLKGT